MFELCPTRRRVLARGWTLRPARRCEEPKDLDNIIIDQCVESNVAGDIDEQSDCKCLRITQGESET